MTDAAPASTGPLDGAAAEAAPAAPPVQAMAAVVAAAVVVEASAPLSRRARRAATAPTPVPVEPTIADASDIAPATVAEVAPDDSEDAGDAGPTDSAAPALPVAEPAPLLDAVLTPAEPFELLEPEIGPLGDAEPAAPAAPAAPHIDLDDAAFAAEEPADAASGVDEFEAAARLFSFTAETPVQPAAVENEEPEVTAHHAVRRGRPSRAAALRRVTAVSFSVGVMGIVGLMTVGMTTPPEAVAAASGAESIAHTVAPSDDDNVGGYDQDEIQAYVAPASTQSTAVVRDERYTMTSLAQLASEAGIRNFSNLFVNDPNSNVQWPFPVGVSMTDGYGPRDGGMHEGIDFTPGDGAPIQAVADGTVRIATESGGAFGVTVLIDHVVDGKVYSSRYAHMQYGSLKVEQGQRVTVGTVIGNTGNTGRSFGAHLHLEILQNGTTAIDPWSWLQTYTTGTYTVG